MFQSMQMAPPDAILGLNEQFRNDDNPDKINLGVGVYKDESGITPILDCVKRAEQQILEQENSKSYLGMQGLEAYGPLVRNLLAPGKLENGRAVTLQTPGGTGALRVAGDFLRQKVNARRIWVSTPTWANHPSIFKAAGLEVATYDYLGENGITLDFQSFCDSLLQIPAGDVACLHACCHNPTGVDPTIEQWQQIADICSKQKILPLIDFAYQGFGNGIDEDAAALLPFVDSGNELMVCSSFSKNFGLYCERIGALTLVADSPDSAQIALSHVKLSVRTNYSNPPKHGGAIVQAVLQDTELTHLWHKEVAVMRDRINMLRSAFVSNMAQRTRARDFSFINDQRGMFSYSGLTKTQVENLKNNHSIYIVGSGRINIAGISNANIDVLCDAIAAVIDD